MLGIRKVVGHPLQEDFAFACGAWIPDIRLRRIPE
jgi:hypothetical protein